MVRAALVPFCALIGLMAIAFIATVHTTELLPYNPVANSRATIVVGNARFTVLTERIIRMEYRTTAPKFEDRATMAFLNRDTPVPNFKVDNTSTRGIIHITTEALRLSYMLGKPFGPDSLTVASLYNPSQFKTWHYGDLNPGNLLGTIRSLDQLDVISLNCTENKNVDVHGEQLHCEWGLISRDGWVVVNDTDNWGLTAADVKPDNNAEWWDSPNTDAEDLYFFGHGHDYRRALSEYTRLLSGRISMVPRYASGIMWSRWFNVDNYDVKGVVEDYRSRDLPLDVYILDMDWHTKQGWGGYTFDERLFPVPAATTDWLHNQGLSVSVNLHDDDGVRPNEAMYEQLAKYMGLNPKTAGTIPFSIVNSTYVYGLEDIVLGDLEKQGVDFWWIDWQQGGTQGGAKGGKQNPTIWLNHIRGTDHVRRGQTERGIVLARWGGLGNHRYQVGFSGDVNTLSWANLAFQPYFSLTATNVAYGFWSHDLVGPSNDLELYTRWLQWGAYSGVFRTHDRGMSAGGCANANPPNCAIVEVWKVPDPYWTANRMALQARESLLPLIYTGHRIAFETGLSLIRPMYYAYPDIDDAYEVTASSTLSQFMFASEDVLAAPIVRPANSSDSMATKTVWIPPGAWFDTNSGKLLDIVGNVRHTSLYDLREVPVFIRGGAVIAQSLLVPGNTIGVAMRQYEPLVFSIYPGGNHSHTHVYEDDGHTTAYITSDAYKWTNATYARSADGSSISVTISSEGKGFPEFPKSRAYRIRLVNALPASQVTVNGASVKYVRFTGNSGGLTSGGGWHYDGPEVTLVVDTPVISTSASVDIKITFIRPFADTLLSGLRGGIVHASWAKALLDDAWETPGANSVAGGNVSVAASMGDELGYYAGADTKKFMEVVASFKQIYEWGYYEVQAVPHKLASEQEEEKDKATEQAPAVDGAYNRWAHALALLQGYFV
eukprot:TRINITY_DN519_c1_g1_i1.p1 TRINITY_DN519_c1_g1~~TRINITY_DN519_c1_g1_i1.p1  ORF type:complete len:943 (-),score=155.61 TRINITY_DN519_c1_g1_i1:23-2851(-)